jgi:hypothetical protein
MLRSLKPLENGGGYKGCFRLRRISKPESQYNSPDDAVPAVRMFSIGCRRRPLCSLRWPTRCSLGTVPHQRRHKNQTLGTCSRVENLRGDSRKAADSRKRCRYNHGSHRASSHCCGFTPSRHSPRPYSVLARPRYSRGTDYSASIGRARESYRDASFASAGRQAEKIESCWPEARCQAFQRIRRPEVIEVLLQNLLTTRKSIAPAHEEIMADRTSVSHWTAAQCSVGTIRPVSTAHRDAHMNQQVRGQKPSGSPCGAATVLPSMRDFTGTQLAWRSAVSLVPDGGPARLRGAVR